MAKVEMDLAELDKMRDNEKKLNGIIADLRKEKQEVIDAQPRVTVHHKSYKGVVRGGPNVHDKNIHIHGVQVVRKNHSIGHPHFTEQGMMGRPAHIQDRPVYEYENLDRLFSFAELERQGILTVDLTEQHGETSRDYKNLDSVIEEIRKEETEKVESRMNLLTKKAQDNAEKLAIVQNEYEDKLATLSQEKEKAVKDLLRQLQENDESYKEEIKQLQQEFDDFKEDKKRVTLEEQLDELKKSLEETKAELAVTKTKVPFWKR